MTGLQAQRTWLRTAFEEEGRSVEMAGETWTVVVVWRDGTREPVTDEGGRPAVFASEKEAQETAYLTRRAMDGPDQAACLGVKVLAASDRCDDRQ
jgi:hypothetical protein